MIGVPASGAAAPGSARVPPSSREVAGVEARAVCHLAGEVYVAVFELVGQE
jgi:hypothetical protein